MTDLPKSIRVGYRDFRIEPLSIHEATSLDRLGECNKRDGLIRLCTDHGPQKAANTLIHEVLHAAWYVGYLDAKADEEDAVGVLANQLAQIWRDNPDFVAFMSESLK